MFKASRARQEALTSYRVCRVVLVYPHWQRFTRSPYILPRLDWLDLNIASSHF